MKKRLCLVAMFAVLFMSCTATESFAWDGERKGFLLGAGIGSGFMSVNQELSGLFTASDRTNKMPVSWNLSIGFAPTSHWAVYYAQKDHYMVEDGDWADSRFQGLGVSYYARESSKSAIFSGGIGVGDFGGVEGFDIQGIRGLGLFAGIGYEFNRHWSLEGDLMFSSADRHDFGIDTSTQVAGFIVSLNVLGY